MTNALLTDSFRAAHKVRPKSEHLEPSKVQEANNEQPPTSHSMGNLSNVSRHAIDSTERSIDQVSGAIPFSACMSGHSYGFNLLNTSYRSDETRDSWHITSGDLQTHAQVENSLRFARRLTNDNFNVASPVNRPLNEREEVRIDTTPCYSPSSSDNSTNRVLYASGVETHSCPISRVANDIRSSVDSIARNPLIERDTKESSTAAIEPHSFSLDSIPYIDQTETETETDEIALAFMEELKECCANDRPCESRADRVDDLSQLLRPDGSRIPSTNETSYGRQSTTKDERREFATVGKKPVELNLKKTLQEIEKVEEATECKLKLRDYVSTNPIVLCNTIDR